MTTINSFKRAQQVISALIGGLDPDTGEELPREHVLHRAEVMRALLVCAAALEQVQARAARRAILPVNVGRNWTDEEEQQLIAQYKEGALVATLAATHGRTIRAIEARLERLGLLTADQRTTNNSFSGQASRRDDQ